MPTCTSRPGGLLLATTLAFAAVTAATAQRPTWGSANAVPAARQQHAVAFDEARGSTLVFGGIDQAGNLLADTWDWDGRVWVHHTPATAPSPRFGHAMAYDRHRGVTVLFGGLPSTSATTPLCDTWEWDGGTWRQNMAPISLTERTGHAMAWFGSIQSGEILLHGGLWSTTGAPSHETWAYNGYQWSVRTYNGPPAYANSAMAYVPALARMVFVGSSNNGTTNQWTWNGSGWSQVAPSGNVPIVQFGHSLCFDEARNRLVLVGGQNGAFGSDFTYFGNVTSGTSISWTATSNQNAQSQIVPESRTYGASAYDSTRRQSVFFGGQSLGTGQRLDSLHELPQGSAWTTRRPPAVSPSARMYIDMAFDQARGQSVLFGGWNGALLGDTWTYDGAAWTSHGASPFVPPRRSPAMAYVPTLGLVLMFGGTNHTGAYYDDTARWDGNSWSPQGLATRPSARSDHDMVYDSAQNRVVLFGGYGPAGSLGDTWEYDPSNASSPWSQIATNGAPPARHAHGMAYDSNRQRTVVFGGADTNGQFLGDTWFYHVPSASWQQLSSLAYSPPRRWNPMMEYDPGRGLCVMTGGYGNPQCGNGCASHLNDVWELTASSWMPRTDGPWLILANPIRTTLPAVRESGALVHDTQRQQLVEFGGAGNGQYHADTWIYRTVADSYAPGQQGGGLSVRCTQYPVSGGSTGFEFPSPSGLAWLAFKLEPVTVATFSMQQSGGPVCAAAAWFYGSSPIVLTLLGNPAELHFALPLGLAGMSMTVQGIAYDGPGGCLQVSQPLAVTVQGY